MNRLLWRWDKWLNNPQSLHPRWPWLYWCIYRFSWDDWLFVFENNIARYALLFSGAGYLVLVSDFVAAELEFKTITGGEGSILGLTTGDKLQLIYFGSILIAICRVIYLSRRPTSIRFGPDLTSWVRHGFSEFTFSDFSQFNSEIDHEGHRTLRGKYYTDDWNAFVEDANWKESGQRTDASNVSKAKTREKVNFRAAKERHEGLIRSILTDRYYEYAARRKTGLFFALTFGLVGFALFFVPAIDLLLTLLLR